MPPGERNPDLRGAALWTADVQQPEKGQEMQQDQEIPGTGQVYLCRMFKHEEIPAQVLRFLRGWPVLHAPADQDGEDALPL